MSRLPFAGLLLACLVLRWPAAAAAADERPARVDADGELLPEGATARLGSLRWRDPLVTPTNATQVALSPDGKWLAVGGGDGLVVLDTSSGRPAKWFRPDPTIAAFVFSDDGKTLIAEGRAPKAPDEERSRRAFRRWRVGTGELLGTVEYSRPPQEIDGAVLSRDGRLLLANEGGGKIRLWDAATGKPRLRIERPGESSPPCLSPDGKTLAVAGKDGRIHLFDAEKGKVLRRVGGEDRSCDRPVFSPDGKLLATWAPESLCVWDAAGGQLIHERQSKGWHGGAAFSPDGRYLADADATGIRLWEVSGLKEVRRSEACRDPVRGLAFSADGKLLASAHAYSAGLWDVATGKRLLWPAGHYGPVVRLAFSPDGRSLASGGDGDGTAIIWDLAAGKPRHTFPGHWPAPVALAFAPDGNTLATGDGDANDGADHHEALVRFYDLKRGALAKQFPAHLNGVCDLAFSPDGKTLVSGGGDGRFRLWDPAGGTRLAQLRGGPAFRRVAFSPDGRSLLLHADGGELELRRADLGERRLELSPAGSPVEFAAFLPDGRTLLTTQLAAGKDPMLRGPEAQLRDVTSGRVLRSWPLSAGKESFTGGALSPDGRVLAAFSTDPGDRPVGLWDVAAGKLMVRLSGHHAGVHALAFSPDGDRLASGGGDTTVLLWDATALELTYLWKELSLELADAKGVLALAGQPAKVAQFLGERLAKTQQAEAKAAPLIARLDDDSYEAREEATRALGKLGRTAEPALQLALENNPSLEARTRLKYLLKALAKRPVEATDAFSARQARLALGILERVGGAEARRALEDLAKGRPEGVVAREAKAALERLKWRERRP